MGTALRSLGHSTLTPANLTTLPHFVVSETMNLPNSSGVIVGIGSVPISESRFFISGLVKRRIDLVIESVSDLIRRAFWRDDTEPRTGFVVWHELADARNIW